MTTPCSLPSVLTPPAEFHYTYSEYQYIRFQIRRKIATHDFPAHARIWPMTKRPPRLLDAQRLWDYALKALGMRALTVSELREKLTKRAETPSDVEGVLS